MQVYSRERHVVMIRMHTISADTVELSSHGPVRYSSVHLLSADPVGVGIAVDLLLLQNHLRELQIERSVLTEIQRADVLITQQWLRLM